MADPRGKRAKLAARLPSRVAKACSSQKSAPPVALETLFPGRCAVAAESGADALSACVLERVSCRFCQQLAGTDELALDCDLFDDRSANGSCAPELP